VHDGKLRLERYGLDFDGSGRWTSFSVAKSITSTLVGAAVRDGHIRSMEDKVTAYIPQMRAPLRRGQHPPDPDHDLGVRWNENYGDPQSDVARFNNHQRRRARSRS
jgi:CubicO group peptidase (beta-lactamase class C family)